MWTVALLQYASLCMGQGVFLCYFFNFKDLTINKFVFPSCICTCPLVLACIVRLAGFFFLVCGHRINDYAQKRRLNAVQAKGRLSNAAKILFLSIYVLLGSPIAAAPNDVSNALANRWSLQKA